MKTDFNLDEERKKALNEIEKNEKKLKYGIAGIALYEGIFLLLFIILADWSDRLHQLLFISAMLVYGTLGFGIVALGMFVKINIGRVLKAIETVAFSELND
ncbi:MAG: hypothetical protein FJ214_11945 [Ignavibacteria bacterium]|nr:hypothetical protein [Ignavibacteria bacterium]